MSLEFPGLLHPSCPLDVEFQTRKTIQSFEVFRDETPVASQAVLTTTSPTFNQNGANKENIPPAMMDTFGLPTSKHLKKKSSLQTRIARMPLGQKTIKKGVTNKKFSNGSSLDMVESQERKTRVINQKARELTQLPLADISIAY